MPIVRVRTACLATLLPAVWAQVAPDAKLVPEAASAYRFFAGRRLRCLASLGNIRPPALTAVARARAEALLPREGNLSPTPAETAKLRAIQPVLALHDRVASVDVKLIDLPQAAIALYARSVILISRQALDLLSDTEVQALAAHELGHDYFWDEYEEAVALKQDHRIRELELRCDGVALLTLAAMDIEPGTLTAALAKLDQFNVRFGDPLNPGRYPPAAERTRFHLAFDQLMDRPPDAPPCESK